jgi:hypothetical protein
MNLGPMAPDAGIDARRVALFELLYRRVMHSDASGSIAAR